MKIKVRGVEYEVDAVQSAIDRLEGEFVAAQETARAATEARTAAETALAAKAEEVRLATCDSALDALLERRTAEAKAKEEKEKRLTAVKKAYPTLAEDSRLQSADFVDGLFLAIPQDNGVDALLGRAGNSAAGSERQDNEPGVPMKTARERMLERNASMARSSAEK